MSAPVRVGVPTVVEELGKNLTLLEQVSQDAGNVAGQSGADGPVEEVRNWKLSAPIAPNGWKEEKLTGFRHYANGRRSTPLGWRHGRLRTLTTGRWLLATPTAATAAHVGGSRAVRVIDVSYNPDRTRETIRMRKSKLEKVEEIEEENWEVRSVKNGESSRRVVVLWSQGVFATASSAAHQMPLPDA